MASRLSCVALVVSLLKSHQSGFLAGLSTLNACPTLTHKIKTLQMAKRKGTTLFLDIKGDFDNVNL